MLGEPRPHDTFVLILDFVFDKHLAYCLKQRTFRLFRLAVHLRLRPNGERRVDVHNVLFKGKRDAVRLHVLGLLRDGGGLAGHRVEHSLLFLRHNLDLRIFHRVDHNLVLVRIPIIEKGKGVGNVRLAHTFQIVHLLRGIGKRQYFFKCHNQYF